MKKGTPVSTGIPYGIIMVPKGGREPPRVSPAGMDPSATRSFLRKKIPRKDQRISLAGSYSSAKPFPSTYILPLTTPADALVKPIGLGVFTLQAFALVSKLSRMSSDRLTFSPPAARTFPLTATKARCDRAVGIASCGYHVLFVGSYASRVPIHCSKRPA